MIFPFLVKAFNSICSAFRSSQQSEPLVAASSLTLHTLVECRVCASRYTSVESITKFHSFDPLPLLPSNEMEVGFQATCPFCSTCNDYAYAFKVDCSCNTLVFDHFSVNELNMNTEYFPRTCKSCGKENILYQRRTK